MLPSVVEIIKNLGPSNVPPNGSSDEIDVSKALERSIVESAKKEILAHQYDKLKELGPVLTEEQMFDLITYSIQVDNYDALVLLIRMPCLEFTPTTLLKIIMACIDKNAVLCVRGFFLSEAFVEKHEEIPMAHLLASKSEEMDAVLREYGCDLAFRNATRNLHEFGAQIGLADVEFDENNTSILAINDWSVHITYEPNMKNLFVYSPIADSLPKDDAVRLELYGSLLEGSVLGKDMAGGGCGVDHASEMILMHIRLYMEHAEPTVLYDHANAYVAAVEHWRQVFADHQEMTKEGGEIKYTYAEGLTCFQDPREFNLTELSLNGGNFERVKLLVERGISDVSTRRVLLWGIKHKDVESIVWSLQRGALTEDLDLSKLFAAENKEIINALCHCERFDRKSIDIACTVLKGDELSFGNEKNEYVAFLLDKGFTLESYDCLRTKNFAALKLAVQKKALREYNRQHLGFNLGTSNLEYMRWALEENVVGIVDIFEGALWSGAPMETLDELLAYDESHDKLIVISDLNYISYVHFSPENKKNLPILRYLFQKGFDVNKRYTNGSSLLDVAVEKSDIDAVKVMLEHGAKIETNPVTNLHHPLALSVYNRSIELCELFLTYCKFEDFFASPYGFCIPGEVISFQSAKTPEFREWVRLNTTNASTLNIISSEELKLTAYRHSNDAETRKSLLNQAADLLIESQNKNTNFKMYVALSLAALYRSIGEQEKSRAVIAALKLDEEFSVKHEKNREIIEKFENSITSLNNNECVRSVYTEPGTPMQFFRCEVCNPDKPTEELWVCEHCYHSKHSDCGQSASYYCFSSYKACQQDKMGEPRHIAIINENKKMEMLKKLEGTSTIKNADISAIIAVRESNTVKLTAAFKQQPCLLDTMRILREIIETDNAEMLKVVVSNKLIGLAKSSINGMNIVDFAVQCKSRNVLSTIINDEMLTFDLLSNHYLVKVDDDMLAFLKTLQLPKAKIAYYNAWQNVAAYSRHVGSGVGELDENNTSIFAVDDEFSLHLTFEPNSLNLYIYSPLLDGFPKHPSLLLKLYTVLLQGSLLGSKMIGGGCGVSVKDELILIHNTLEMVHAPDDALVKYSSGFIDNVREWRMKVAQICNDYPWDNLIQYASVKAVVIQWLLVSREISVPTMIDDSTVDLPVDVILLITHFIWNLNKFNNGDVFGNAKVDYTSQLGL